MVYQSKTRAMYYDCDVQNRLKLSAAMRYMQQASSEQMELMEIAPSKLYRENMVFVLSKSCIKVHRMPEASEEILIGTAPTATHGARFVREFSIDSLEGERLLSAFTLWLLIDPSNRRVLRPAHFPYALPLEASFVSDAIGDIVMPKQLTEGKLQTNVIEIGYSHLDHNRHVNNSYYADFICNTLDYRDLLERGIDTLAIGFQNEARHGDRLEIAQYGLAPGEFYLEGTHNANACFEAYVRLR